MIVVGYHLVRWPCGCVHSFGDPSIKATFHVAYQCRWCGDTFSRPDLKLWFVEGETQPPLVGNYRQVIKVEDSNVLEVMGMCADGDLLVRECKRGAKVEHLGVPPEVVEVLRN